MQRFLLSLNAPKVHTVYQMLSALNAGLIEMQRKLEAALAATNSKTQTHAPAATTHSQPSWSNARRSAPAQTELAQNSTANSIPDHLIEAR